jgi:hypothetical protein
MSYEVVETYPTETSEFGESSMALVKLDKKHAHILFADGGVIFTEYFKYQSGWADVSSVNPEFGKVRVTRLLASCKDGHDHGVHYQTPGLVELWEAMFSIGEVNAMPDTTDLEKM